MCGYTHTQTYIQNRSGQELFSTPCINIFYRSLNTTQWLLPQIHIHIIFDRYHANYQILYIKIVLLMILHYNTNKPETYAIAEFNIWIDSVLTKGGNNRDSIGPSLPGTWWRDANHILSSYSWTPWISLDGFGLDPQIFN